MRIALVTCVALFVSGCDGCNPTRGTNGDDVDGANDCSPSGAHRCVGSTYETCLNGQWETAVDCGAACVDALGCVVCNPGQTFCKDGNVWQCDDMGNPQNEVAVCTGVNVCVGGVCVDACADAAANKSYIGCEYWAVDLDNAIEVWGDGSGGCPTDQKQMTLDVCYTQMFGGYYGGQCDPQNDGMAPHTCPGGLTCTSKVVCASDAQHGPFAVVISNPQSKDATVTITGPNGVTFTRVIAAGQVIPILMQAPGTNIPDQSLDWTGKYKKAYRIVSDLPIVAYQFNPLDNVNVFSNDASLLIPRATFDVDYYAMSWPTLNRRPNKDPYYGYLTIVAAQDGTQITVTPSQTVVAGQTQMQINAGSTATFTLNAFEVLNLEAAVAAGQGGTGDLTGTHITSPNMMPFGVFGGHEASAFGGSSAPDMQHPIGPAFADHLEEMLFPSTTWGMGFAITRSKKRLTEPDYLRVLAQKPGTTVSFTPAPVKLVGGNCQLLNPGEYCDVEIQEDTEIVASQPVLVGHFLESAMWCNMAVTSCVGTGDPSMAIAVPVEQFRKDYTILVPAQYAENYVSIAAAATGGVAIDGVPVTLTMFPGGGTHRAARAPLAAGQHKITCADGCGITVYGYSPAVSYMFAGGLDLKPIVIL